MKYLELHRYYCEKCDTSFKVDYEDGKLIEYCPFCGEPRNNENGSDLESIVFDGIFEYNAEEILW